MTKFKTNDRVKVNKASLLTYGCVGTVQTAYCDSCYVVLDSGKTLYYNFSSLIAATTEEKEENDMGIMGDFKVAKIKFLNGSNQSTEYEYAMFDNYNVGDTVVVASAHHGLGIAKITAIISQEQAVTKKFEREIVCRIDMSIYEQRKKNRARLQELQNKMNQRAQEINKLAMFEMLAEKDVELQGMLSEYKALMQ